ncbi:hypothetical protein BT96DRAFT_995110 [Gymnopus androsaceus JB14]|uniref:Uncharacterized protein n=1 Tax=Gymnopus androsaceus JB14 TaxID=1447944 RepID=A0A6A4HI61_9AGAR|nr:hypothetical protein BT96DRAFT_995110 [Gymnopus androsaceus JB14]
MEIAPPTNTPPPQYTPPAPAPAPAPAAPKKRGEATDIRPKVKHDQKLTGSTVVDDWRRMTSDQIYALIEAGTPPFENITLSAGMRKANLGAINRVFLNHYHVKLKKADASGASGDTVLSHQDAMKIIESRELFKLEMADDIQQRVNQSENYQTVVKSMWDELTEEKRARWNEKAKQVDVAGDQSRLIVALPILFKALAAAGRVGPLEAMVLFSYHDEKQVVHTNSSRQDPVDRITGRKLAKSNSTSSLCTRFTSGRLKPCLLSKEEMCSHTNEEGFPIFPDVELSELTGKDVQILVRGFLTKIWGTQYNGSEIPWEKINTEPLSFYDKQKFKLPFPLSDPRAMSGGKAMALAEYFQEQGSVFRFQQPSARPPATASVASTSGSAVTPAHPIPSASTEGSEDTATPVATATAPTIRLTSGSECALTPLPAPFELTPEVERAITPLAVSYPSTPGSTLTATGQAAPASPAPPTPPMPSTSGTGGSNAAITPIAAGSIESTSGVNLLPFPTHCNAGNHFDCHSLAASPIGPASLTSKALATSGGRKGNVADAQRSNRVRLTAKAKMGTSEEAGLSGTTAPPKGKKQSRFWTYETVLVDGPAETTMDEGAVGTSRKRGRPAKNGEGMEDANGLQAARKKKRT